MSTFLKYLNESYRVHWNQDLYNYSNLNSIILIAVIFSLLMSNQLKILGVYYR